MFSKTPLPLLLLFVICLELIIYLWSRWTSTLDLSNFFAIEPAFIFDKCARNSGRLSSAINLVIVLLIGYSGYRQISQDATKWKELRVLLTVFALNHFVHFFYVFQTFKHHAMELRISDNLHGFITVCCILLVPVITWFIKHLKPALFICIVLHLFNVSYFIMETFYNKITPEKPAYHNQFGILVTTAACAYLLIKSIREFKTMAVQKTKQDHY